MPGKANIDYTLPSKKTEAEAKELKQINDTMVGRELKMIELKKEITELKKQLAEKHATQ